MDNYFNYNLRATLCGSVQRALRDIRRKQTYSGCDPYTSFYGVNW